MKSFVVKLVLVSALFCKGLWAGWDRLPGPAQWASADMSPDQYISIAAFVCDPEANPIQGLDSIEAKKILYVYFLSFLKRALPPGAQPGWLTSLDVTMDADGSFHLSFLDWEENVGIVAALDPLITAFAHMLHVGEDEGSLPSFLLAEVLGVVAQTVWAHHSTPMPAPADSLPGTPVTMVHHMSSFCLISEEHEALLLEPFTAALQDPSLENVTHLSSQMLTHMADHFSTGQDHHMLVELLGQPHPQMVALFQSVCHWLNQLNLVPQAGTVQMLQHIIALNVRFLVSQRNEMEAREREAARMVRRAVQWGVDHAANLLRNMGRGGILATEGGSAPMGLPIRWSNVAFPVAAHGIPHGGEANRGAESSGAGLPPAQPQTPMGGSPQAEGQRLGLPVIEIHLENGVIMRYVDGRWVTEI